MNPLLTFVLILITPATTGSLNITEDIELKKLDLKKKSWDLHNLMSVAMGDSLVKLKVDAITSEVQHGMDLYGHSDLGEICYQYKTCVEHHLQENQRLISEGNSLISKAVEELEDLLKHADFGYMEFLNVELSKTSYKEILDAIDKITHQLILNVKEYLHCHTSYEYHKEKYEIHKLKESLSYHDQY